MPVSGGHAVERIGVVGDTASLVHRLDPRAKLIGFAWITLVGVSTPASAWPVWLGCAATLVALGALAGVPVGVVARRASVVLPLVLFVAVFLPFAREGGATVRLGPFAVSEAGLTMFAEVSAKATIGTLSAVLLGATTAFPDLLRALAALRVPRVLVLIAAFGYRYLWVLVDDLRRLRAALAARAYRPRHALRVAPLGRAASALFLRSYERGERVYLAMLARGYSDTVPSLRPLALARVDVAFVVVLVVSLGALRLVVGVAA